MQAQDSRAEHRYPRHHR